MSNFEQRITVSCIDDDQRRIYATTRSLFHNSGRYAKAKQRLEQLPQIVDIDELSDTMMIVRGQRPGVLGAVENSIIEQLILGLTWEGREVEIYDRTMVNGQPHLELRERGSVNTIQGVQQYRTTEVTHA